MVTVNYDGSLFEGFRAAKTEHDVLVYDEYNRIIHHISDIYDDEWNYITIENGTWANEEAIPDELQTLRADLDYLTMWNETLEEENKSLRADLDFCLMMLES